MNWKRTFFTIWGGQAVSTLTSSIVQFAIIWHLTDSTRSAMILSLASVAAFLPQGILGPLIGVYVDRWNRKTVMLLSDLCIALACCAIIVWGLLAQTPTWVFVAVLALRSVGAAFHSPSLAAVTPLLVPKEQLTRCAGYSQSLQSFSLIAAPALAAMLYASWRLEWILLVDICGALAGIGTLAVCKIPRLPAASRQTRPRLLDDARDAFHALRLHKGLDCLLLMGCLYYLAFLPVNALLPLICMDYFGGGAAQAGIAEIAFSGGLLGGSILLGLWGGFRNQMHTIAAAMSVTGGALIASGLLAPGKFPMFALLAAVMGLGCPFYAGVSAALLQKKVAPQYLGRITSLSSSSMTLSAPVGMALAGAAAERIGINLWFSAAGGAIALCAVLCVLLPQMRACASGG